MEQTRHWYFPSSKVVKLVSKVLEPRNLLKTNFSSLNFYLYSNHHSSENFITKKFQQNCSIFQDFCSEESVTITNFSKIDPNLKKICHEPFSNGPLGTALFRNSCSKYCIDGQLPFQRVFQGNAYGRYLNAWNSWSIRDKHIQTPL